MLTPVSSVPATHAVQPTTPQHPAGSRANVLLCSVFGPYAQDDEYGSRAMNPMELYQNQVTREQGPFSLRMFHRSWGLMLMQANMQAPCTLLDFPTLDRFIEELRQQQYDIVGISGIPVNVLKVSKMCDLVRQYQPQATVVVGGHVANVRNLDQQLDADFIVRGEGVRWFRRFLGEDEQQPIRHPLITSGIGIRSVGMTIKERPGSVGATVIPSVGCPLGCNFCATSAMFGGKGKFINFYDSGDELFDVMVTLERQMKVSSFFMMDENFLLHRRRALRLLELMQQNDKSWSLYVFSSGKVLANYTHEQLVALGISWVWMGLEGEASQYSKLRGVNTHELVRELQSHGIKILGSTIIGMEEHTPENIDQVIDYAVRHDTDFHQFMLYTPIEGTPLHAEMLEQGRLKPRSEYHPADAHGQFKFNYHHSHIRDGRETEMLARAFRHDLEVNGPSIVRVARTMLAGWKQHREHPDQRVRRRFAREARELVTTYAPIVSAARRYYRQSPELHAKMSRLLSEICDQLGWTTRIAATLGGRYLSWKIRQEERRLASGWKYEPPTFYEKNSAAASAMNSCSASLA
ncbi:MAG: cobalamin-dependent protein [Pirellulaceae bacterium]|nr:cobalamin-dependent protein [Pirellulaceae bacterium]